MHQRLKVIAFTAMLCQAAISSVTFFNDFLAYREEVIIAQVIEELDAASNTTISPISH